MVSTFVFNSHWFIVMLCNFSWVDCISLELRDHAQLLKIPKLNIVHRKFPVNIINNGLIES